MKYAGPAVADVTGRLGDTVIGGNSRHGGLSDQRAYDVGNERAGDDKDGDQRSA